MRAIQIDRYGGPEVITRRELPVPVPGPGEVLIRLAFSGINFMDIHTQQGKYAGSRTYPQTLPTTLGIEGAGTVAALGDGATEFQVGDRVAYCLAWGSYAEYAVVAAWRVVPVAYLAPSITTAILEGRQPTALTPSRLMRDTRLPLAWAEQEQLLGLS